SAAPARQPAGKKSRRGGQSGGQPRYWGCKEHAVRQSLPDLRAKFRTERGKKMVQQRISRDRNAARIARLGGLAAALALALSGGVGGSDVSSSLPDVPTRWDHRPEADNWTAAAFVAVAEKDHVLASRVPADIETWCPGYNEATLNERRAFWVGLMSAVAKKES